MTNKKKTVELKDDELEKVTGGTDEFPEAEELSLECREKKELKKENKPKN